MKYILIGMVKIYQITPLPTHKMCRHIPTCSQYMIESLNKFGTFKGLLLGIKRILRCNPLGTYGYDPVKERKFLNEKII